MDFTSFKGLITRSGSSKMNTNKNGAESQDHTKKIDNTKAGGSSWDTPYLKIETIPDRDEDYQEDSRRSTATLGNNSHQSQTSLLHTATTQSPNKTASSHTPSPYLSIASPNLRRSSTSDIIQPEAPSQQPENRRPSTSSLLRKARERKDVGGTGGQMGRSISQLATPTAGRTARSAALGQRRKSMAAF